MLDPVFLDHLGGLVGHEPSALLLLHDGGRHGVGDGPTAISGTIDPHAGEIAISFFDRSSRSRRRFGRSRRVVATATVRVARVAARTVTGSEPC